MTYPFSKTIWISGIKLNSTHDQFRLQLQQNKRGRSLFKHPWIYEIKKVTVPLIPKL